MNAYAAADSITNGGGGVEMITLFGATSARPSVYELGVSAVATPEDHTSHFVLYVTDSTTAATGGSDLSNIVGTYNTGRKLDASNPNSGITVKKGATIGTNANKILVFSVNKRATYRWVAAPHGHVKAAASSTASVGIRCMAGTQTYNCETYMEWFE